MGVTNFDQLALSTGLSESNLGNPAADGLHAMRVARFTYDFDEHGGAIGNIDLETVLPDNAIVLDGMVDVITTFTTAGGDAGTIAITMGAQAANLIVTAVAVGTGTPWDEGLHDIIPVGTAATAVKLTAARAVRIVIGGQVVTAGKLVGFLRYVVSD